MRFLLPKILPAGALTIGLLAAGLALSTGSAHAQTTRNSYTSVNPYTGTVTRTTVTRPNVVGIGGIIANQNIYGSAYPGTTTQTTVTYGTPNVYLGGPACAPVIAPNCAPIYGQNYVYPGYPAQTYNYPYPCAPSTTVIAPPATNWQQPSYLTSIPLGGSVSTYSQTDTTGYAYPGTTVFAGTTYTYPANPSITEVSPPSRDWQVPSYVTTIPLSGSVSSTYSQTTPAYPPYVVNNYYNTGRSPSAPQAQPLFAPGYPNVYSQQRFGNNNQVNGSTGNGYRGNNSVQNNGFNGRSGNTLNNNPSNPLATTIPNNTPASTFNQNKNLNDTGTVTTWTR